ncbi:tetratricopeptide repeat protein [Flavitalea flava]
MNQFSRLFYGGIVWLVILSGACKGPENKKEDGSEAILHRPPFSGLTDSIRQARTADKPGLYVSRGELLSRNNLHELAAADFKKAWDIQPVEGTGLRYASTLSIIGQTGNAISLLQDCLKKFPANQNFPSLLSDLYQQSGRTKEALQLYDTLLQTDSLNFEAWYEKGLVLEKTKDTTRALIALNKAYTLQPVNTYALELAHLYAENRDSRAIGLCDDVLRKDSGNELLDPLFIKGIYFSNTGQYKKAIVQFDSCTRRDWKYTDAYLEKGIALFELKKVEEALQTFLMTIKVSNTYADGYFWAGRCYETLGANDDALIYYQRALALDKNFTEARERIKKIKK